MSQTSFYCRHLICLVCYLLLDGCQSFTAQQKPLLHRKTLNSKPSSSSLSASQLLEFVEPTTGVKVKLVGSMHYNPTSIELARDTIQGLAQENKLGSIVIESCDLRWNSTVSTEPWLQKLLYSEMKQAHDLGIEYKRPVVLGDQRINVTVEALGEGFKETLVDFFNPTSWKSAATTVLKARKEAVPFGGEYLGAASFLDQKLLLAAPVALFKYPLSYVAKAPIASIAVFGLLFWGEAAGATTVDQMTTTEWVEDIVITVVETLLFARVFLKELLADRNEILAQNILEQCKLYKADNSFSLGRFFGQPITKNEEIMYAPDTVRPKFEKDGKKEVVAVLGMAHCNGIMKLLKEQRV